MYGFNVLAPIEIDDEVLTSTNVVESAPAWNATEAGYSPEDVVSHANHVWEATDAVTTAAEPGVALDGWIDLGADNVHAMFDDSIQTQSINAGSIEVGLTIPSGVRANCLYAENIDAVSASLVITDPVEGVIHEEEQSLVDLYSTSLWEWLYNPIRRRRFVLFEGFLANPAAVVTFTAETYGGTAAVGDCVLARAEHIGVTLYGGEISFIDFSVKTRNEISGAFQITERTFARTGAFSVLTARFHRDSIWQTLEDARASRRVFIACDESRATIINGFLTLARSVLSYPNHDVLSLEAESLV